MFSVGDVLIDVFWIKIVKVITISNFMLCTDIHYQNKWYYYALDDYDVYLLSSSIIFKEIENYIGK